ncbi:MAG: AMP-binding protein [Eubacterium sp.]|nr:AMP-binding protein [Eubacterium sp.]
METLVNRIRVLAEEKQGSLAVAFKKQSLTYGELYRVSCSMARVLLKEGVKKGDRVSFSAVSKPEMVVTYLALQLIGAVSVYLDKNSTAANMYDIYVESDSVILLTDKPMKDYAEKVNLRSLRVLYGEAEEASKAGNNDTEASKTGVKDTETPKAENEDAELLGSGNEEVLSTDRDADEISEILFTTGTTGKPKGVMLSYKSVYNILSNTIEGIGIREGDTLLLPLPLNHSFALRVLRAILYKGATLILQNGFTFAKEVENNITTFGCNTLASVPASYEVMRSQMQDEFTRVLGGLRYIEFGAGALSPRQRKELKELLPGVQIYNTWGSSESGGAVFCDVTSVTDDPKRIGTLGKPLAGKIEVRALDNAGNEIETDEAHPGRMSIKGDMIMAGYWKNEELSKETLKDGWLLTSDMIYMDEDGYVYMLGRADDIINVGGEKVSPLEVEAAAGGYKGISDCACIGAEDPDGVLGQIPVLFSVVNSGYNEQELIKYLSERLEKYKLPRRYVILETMPRNRMQKLDRRALRDIWENQDSLDLINPVMQAILSRRSIRRFTDKEIPKNILDMILKAGIHAPSGHNMQSWRFTVLTKEDDILKLKSATIESAETAGVVVYGFENPKAMILVSNDDRNPDGCQDSSCAAENMLLAAESYGLGAVWLNPLMTMRNVEPVKSVLDSFGIPANHTVWSAISLGYASHEGAKLQKKESVIKYI